MRASDNSANSESAFIPKEWPALHLAPGRLQQPAPPRFGQRQQRDRYPLVRHQPALLHRLLLSPGVLTLIPLLRALEPRRRNHGGGDFPVLFDGHWRHCRARKNIAKRLLCFGCRDFAYLVTLVQPPPANALADCLHAFRSIQNPGALSSRLRGNDELGSGTTIASAAVIPAAAGIQSV